MCGKKVLIQSGENPSWLIGNCESYILNWESIISNWKESWKNSTCEEIIHYNIIFSKLVNSSWLLNSIGEKSSWKATSVPSWNKALKK